MIDFENKLREFVELCQRDYTAHMARLYPSLDLSTRFYQITTKPGKKYAKVDYGDSGKYMVDYETGTIWGIKAYGVVHTGHIYGTIDTVQDYFWGDYIATRKSLFLKGTLVAMQYADGHIAVTY